MTDQNGQLEIKADLAVTESGEITGIAWPFGSADRYGDLITKGAFSSPDTLPMLFGHNPNEPIGVWHEIRETAHGLEVRGRLLINDVEKAREAHALVTVPAHPGARITSAKDATAAIAIAEAINRAAVALKTQ